jgi:RNA polymerase sigma-70 factor (ECF subfamily)
MERIGAYRVTDNELVDLARIGDQTAFRLLVERYQKRVFAVAFGVVKNEEDALDVTQDAFVKVYRYLGRFHGTSSFYTWLYRIVVNLCIDHVRKSNRVGLVDYDDGTNHHHGVDSSAGRFAGVPTPTPGEDLHRKELGTELSRALDALSEKHRQVIVLREIEGLSYNDMAEVLGVSVGTVMSRLHHARHNMQATLRRYMSRG